MGQEVPGTPSRYSPPKGEPPLIFQKSSAPENIPVQKSLLLPLYQMGGSYPVRFVTLLKRRLQYRCFPVNFAKFLTTFFFTEHLQWLFLLLIILIMQ